MDAGGLKAEGSTVIFSGDAREGAILDGLVWFVASPGPIGSGSQWPLSEQVLFATDVAEFCRVAGNGLDEPWGEAVLAEMAAWEGMFSETRVSALSGQGPGAMGAWERVSSAFLKAVFPRSATVFVSRRGATMKSKVAGGVFLGNFSFVTGDFHRATRSPESLADSAWVCVDAPAGIMPAAKEARSVFESRLLENVVACADNPSKEDSV